jgi:hypothetical protein
MTNPRYSATAILLAFACVLAIEEPLVYLGGGFSIGHRFGCGFFWGPKVFVGAALPDRHDWSKWHFVQCAVGFNRTKLEGTYEMMGYCDLSLGTSASVLDFACSYGGGVGFCWKGNRGQVGFHDKSVCPRIAVFGGSFVMADVSLMLNTTPDHPPLETGIGGTVGGLLPVSWSIPGSKWKGD